MNVVLLTDKLSSPDVASLENENTVRPVVE